MGREIRPNQVQGGVLEDHPTILNARVRAGAFGTFPIWLSVLAVVAIAGSLAFMMLRPKEPTKSAADGGMADCSTTVQRHSF